MERKYGLNWRSQQDFTLGLTVCPYDTETLQEHEGMNENRNSSRIF
jgi:hypothetical protein